MDLFTKLLKYNFLQWIFQTDLHLGEFLVFRHINKEFSKELNPQNKLNNCVYVKNSVQKYFIKSILKRKHMKLFVIMIQKYKYNLIYTHDRCSSIYGDSYLKEQMFPLNSLCVSISNQEEEINQFLTFKYIMNDVREKLSANKNNKIQIYNKTFFKNVISLALRAGNIRICEHIIKKFKYNNSLPRYFIRDYIVNDSALIHDLLLLRNIDIIKYVIENLKGSKRIFSEQIRYLMGKCKFDIDFYEKIKLYSFCSIKLIDFEFFEIAKKDLSIFLLEIGNTFRIR
jgi:hypothetical protein